MPGGPVGFSTGANSHFANILTASSRTRSTTAGASVTELNYVHDDLAQGERAAAPRSISPTLSTTNGPSPDAPRSSPIRATAYAVRFLPGLRKCRQGPRLCQWPSAGSSRTLRYAAQRQSRPAQAYNVTYGEVTVGANYKPAVCRPGQLRDPAGDSLRHGDRRTAGLKPVQHERRRSWHQVQPVHPRGRR